MIKGDAIKRYAVVLLFFAAMLALAGQSERTAGTFAGVFVGTANAQAVNCSANTMRKATRRSGGRLSSQDQDLFVSWCRSAVQTERKAQAAASTRATIGSATRGTTGGTTGTTGAMSLAAPDPGGTGIICTANNCVCWKGKHWNGCNDITICAGPLKCTGPICSCKPH